METMPWTKSECFAWNDGRRIVDLYELSKQLHCKQCSSLLDLRRTEREARYGLSSILYIHCNCGVLNDVHTGRIQQGGGDQSSQRPMYEINIKASINLLMYGAGASRVLSFLALLDIPVPPPDDPSLIVPVSDSTDTPTASTDIPVSNANATTSASTTASSTPKQPSEGQTKKASFQKTLSSSARGDTTSSSVPDPACHVNNEQEESLQVADTETEEVNDSQTTDGGQNGDEDEQGEKDDEDGDGGDEDDDDEYVPSTRLKLRLKTRTPSPSKSKKPSLRGPKSARAKKAAKSVSEKKVKKLQVKVKKVAKKTSKAEEKETSKAREEDSSSKDFENTMDWSSTESEQGNSDASWHEQNEEDEDYNVPEETPTKRKRGRPKGATDKAKRAKKSSTPKEKKEGNNKKAKGEGEEEKEVPRCASCDKDFNSIKGYNVHMKRVHNQDMKGKVDPVVYVCDICKQPFARDYSVITHLETKHWTPTLEPKESFYVVPMREVIQRVSKQAVFRNGRMRERHGTTQECLRCGQTSISQDKASKHICVNREGQLTCVNVCPEGKKLSHMQRCLLYSTKLGHLCDHCGSIFSHKASFDMHLIKVHGQITQRSEKYKCATCNHSFGDSSALRHHERTHVSKATNDHVCDVCGKGFRTAHTLKVHRGRVHVTPKRYQCEFCPKMFYGKSRWKTHMQQHLGESPYHCSVCNQGFSSNYCLNVHMRIHTGEKPFKCQYCDAAFAQKNSIDVHMKKHMKRGDIDSSSQDKGYQESGGNKDENKPPSLQQRAEPGSGMPYGESTVEGPVELVQLSSSRAGSSSSDSYMQKTLSHFHMASSAVVGHYPALLREHGMDIPVSGPPAFPGSSSFPGFPGCVEPHLGLPLSVPSRRQPR